MVVLSRRLHGPSKQLYTALTFLAARQTTLADHAAALATCTEIETLVRDMPLDPPTIAFVRGPTAINAFWRGDVDRARTLLEELVHHELVPGPRPSALVRRHTVLVVYLAAATWLTGDPDRALMIAQRAREIARETQDPYAAAAAGNMLSELHVLRGDSRDEIRASARTVLALPATEAWHPNAHIVLALANHADEPITEVMATELVERLRKRSAAMPMGTTWLALFAIEALRAGGHIALAREVADSAIAFARTHEELVVEPRLVKLRESLG
jgi:hypothetical protein